MEYLICPECRQELKLHEFITCDNVINEGMIECRSCSLQFPIIDGIPRILPLPMLAELVKGYSEFLSKYGKKVPEKYKLDEQGNFEKTLKVGLTYDYGWNVFPEILDEYRNEFLHVLGDHLSEKDFRLKVILDAGCGMGRFAKFVQEFGASEIIGFDINEAVITAQRHCESFPNIHFFQGNIFYLPLRSRFDIIYCIGVIHHLTKPGKGFKNLIDLLKPEGKIFIWVYGYSGIVPFLNGMRIFSRKLPLPLIRILSFVPALILYGVICVYKIFLHVVFLKYLAKYIPFHQYADRSFKGIRWVAQDHLTVPIINYFCKDDIEGWLKDSCLVDIKISCRYPGKLGRSWRVSGNMSKNK